MELWTALLIGLGGSLHCIGMCGPIAVVLPSGQQSRLGHVFGRVAYNSGRIITYAFLGMICGLIGRTLLMAGYQRWVSIGLGIVLLVGVFLPSKYAARLAPKGWHAKFVGRIKKVWGRLFSKGSTGSLFVIGLLNGFLPCGLVYVALVGAISTGTALGGAAYMATFGAGTFPVMFAISVFGALIGVRFKRRLNKLMPIGAIVLAALFILRGLSLGIPYISPVLENTDKGEVKVHCCPSTSIPSE